MKQLLTLCLILVGLDSQAQYENTLSAEALVWYQVIIIAIMIGSWLVVRKLVLWYYKVDERIELMHENNRLLRKLTEGIADNTPTASVSKLIEEIKNKPTLNEVLAPKKN